MRRKIRELTKGDKARPMVDECVHALAKFMALLGGVVLCAVILLVGISVLGRAIADLLHPLRDTVPVGGVLLDMGIGAIRGDFEWVEAGMGFVVFAFMPWAALCHAHARVDLFAPYMPRGLRRLTQLLGLWGFALAFCVIAVMLGLGTWSKYQSGQTSFILGLPVWMPQAAGVIAAFAAVFVTGYVAICATRGAMRDE